MSITELRHQLASFNVPDRNETSIVSGNHSFKFCVIESERDRVLVAGLDLFLSLEEPEVDLSGASQDVVGCAIEND